jgi:hypothetical protein
MPTREAIPIQAGLNVAGIIHDAVWRGAVKG